jgi:EF-hand domain pair
MLSSAQLKEAFDGFDKDKSGFLDMDEVVSLANTLGVKTSKKELTDLFASIDVNHDNKASFDEFLAWYRVGKHSKLTKLLKYQLEMKNQLKKTQTTMQTSGTDSGPPANSIQYFNVLVYDRETSGTVMEVNLEVGEGNERMKNIMKLAFPMANPKDPRIYFRIKSSSEEKATELAEAFDSFITAAMFQAQEHRELQEFSAQLRNMIFQVRSVGTQVVIATMLENTEIGSSFIPILDHVVKILKDVAFNGDIALSFSKSLKDILKRVGLQP